VKRRKGVQGVIEHASAALPPGVATLEQAGHIKPVFGFFKLLSFLVLVLYLYPYMKNPADTRKPYSGLSRSLVIAIDVGTTFSGVRITTTTLIMLIGFFRYPMLF
jgi:hypothetical protein